MFNYKESENKPFRKWNSNKNKKFISSNNNNKYCINNNNNNNNNSNRFNCNPQNKEVIKKKKCEWKFKKKKKL